MSNKEYADFIIPDVPYDIDYYKKIYPKRNLKEGAIVTRFAPSPTGFVHIGSLFTSFIAWKVAKQTDGIIYLRIEDTDQKRTIENGVINIINDLKKFDVVFDEGMIDEKNENGAYGPYLQSNRSNIYKAFAKYLIEKDLAYPCFLTTEELEIMKNEQEATKTRIGCYGKWAKYRNLTKEEVIEKIKNGEKYIIRLKSPGDFDNKVVIEDLVRGRLEFPENDLDIVMIKADDLPTYHFAHLVDDYLMGTTNVIRGDEWVSSLPIHVQLFDIFGFKRPYFCHLSPLNKKEGDSVRKLSKRKDPEAAVSYYHEEGIPSEAVKLYIMTVANSNFEMWLEQNPDKNINDFNFDFAKMGSSGSLFDLNKLNNISKNYISTLSAKEVYDYALEYLKEFDGELYDLMIKYKEYSISVFNIERQQLKPRKDISSWKDVRREVWYMYDELFNPNLEDYEFNKITDIDEILKLSKSYLEDYFDSSDDKDTWFNKIKDLSEKIGYAREVKMYKQSPDAYKGHVGDVSMVLRVVVTTKSMTPDLYEIMSLLGKDRMLERLRKLENEKGRQD